MKYNILINSRIVAKNATFWQMVKIYGGMTAQQKAGFSCHIIGGNNE